MKQKIIKVQEELKITIAISEKQGASLVDDVYLCSLYIFDMEGITDVTSAFCFGILERFEINGLSVKQMLETIKFINHNQALTFALEDAIKRMQKQEDGKRLKQEHEINKELQKIDQLFNELQQEYNKLKKQIDKHKENFPELLTKGAFYKKLALARRKSEQLDDMLLYMIDIHDGYESKYELGDDNNGGKTNI